jgi:hypothetical protein
VGNICHRHSPFPFVATLVLLAENFPITPMAGMVRLSFLFLCSSVSFIDSRAIPNSQLRQYPKIALTRDEEGNQNLQKLLSRRGLSTVQLPSIEFSDGQDQITSDHINNCDIVVVTSAQVEDCLSPLNLLVGGLSTWEILFPKTTQALCCIYWTCNYKTPQRIWFVPFPLQMMISQASHQLLNLLNPPPKLLDPNCQRYM